MALLPTGSDKVLEIYTSEMNIVIKAKKIWPGSSSEACSSVAVAGRHIKRIQIPAVEDDTEYTDVEYGNYEISRRRYSLNRQIMRLS